MPSVFLIIYTYPCIGSECLVKVVHYMTSYQGELNFSNSNYVQLSKGDIFSVLQNDRRRHFLELLNTNGGSSLRDISEEIAQMESGVSAPESKLRKSIYVSLLQTHLPKMEKLGIVRYDRDVDLVELTSAAANLSIYLETVEKGDIPWSHYYVGLSVVALLGSLLVFSGSLELFTSIQWLFFVDLLFLLSSVAHLVHMKKVSI